MSQSELEDSFVFQIRAAGLPVPERQFKAILDRRWRWDLAFPEQFLLIEIDGGIWTGGRHVTGKGIEADCEKQSTAAAAGYRTMRLCRSLIESGRALELLEVALRQAAEGVG